MGDIVELERRMTAAMDRLSKCVEKYEAGSNTAESDAQSDEIAGLKAKIEELTSERDSARAELKAAQAELQSAKATPEVAKSSVDSEALAQLDSEIQKLRKANEALRDNNKALREANAAGLGDAILVNKAMMAELDSMRAARSADVAEMDAILSALEPLVDNANLEEADA